MTRLALTVAWHGGCYRGFQLFISLIVGILNEGFYQRRRYDPTSLRVGALLVSHIRRLVNAACHGIVWCVCAQVGVYLRSKSSRSDCLAISGFKVRTSAASPHMLYYKL